VQFYVSCIVQGLFQLKKEKVVNLYSASSQTRL